MTTKDYLSQAFTLSRLIKAKESRIADLRDMQTRIGKASAGVKVQSRPKHDPMGDVTAMLLDLIKVYKKDCVRLLALQREIEAQINKVTQPIWHLILFERYVNLKAWEDVAADNGYSLRAVHKIHSAVLAYIDDGRDIGFFPDS